MQWYPLLKQIHITSVVLSLSGFVLRWLLSLRWPGLIRKRWLRTLPVLVDTVLLGSAIGMALIIQQYPLVNHWLTAKLAGLLAYILFGALALRYGRGLRQRSAYFVLALLSAGYIVGVAITKNSWPLT